MSWLRRCALGLGILVALAVAGCGGADDKGDKAKTTSAKDGTYTVADLKAFVMTTSDLPDGYRTENVRSSTSADTCLAVEGQPIVEQKLKETYATLGFQACAGAGFKKKVEGGVSKNNRPAALMILMRDADSASKALQPLREALLKSFTTTGTAGEFAPHSLPAPTGLGDETTKGITLKGNLGAAIGDTTFYIYVWRRGNVVAWVGSSDILGDFDQARTLELAHKLDDRGAS
jgi:hypothetical protein